MNLRTITRSATDGLIPNVSAISENAFFSSGVTFTERETFASFMVASCVVMKVVVPVEDFGARKIIEIR